MDQIEDLHEDKPAVAAATKRPTDRNDRAPAAPRGAAALAACGIVAGALVLANRRNSRESSRVRPALAPADRTLAWASPALLGASPQRRFYSGSNLDRAVTIEDLRAMAHRRLPRFALEYLESGGEDEAALARNIAALAEWRFLHRSMVDVSRRDSSTVLFGRKTPIPLAIAPTGLNELFWPHADLR
ncbi:MAG: alpha-hydroxy acid oxidase, partial [Stellaceae bacterium]